MSDIQLTADFTDIQTMNRELLETAKSAKASARVFESEYNKVERLLNRTAKANQEYFNSVLGVGRATKSAATSSEVFNRAFKEQQKSADLAAKAAKRHSDEVERLRTKYDPLFAASKRYERAVEELEAAFQVGAISNQRYRQSLDSLNMEFDEFNRGVARAGNQFASYDLATFQATQRLKRFGSVGLQQVGYQVGDFAVQLQGGTNAAVALGQQGSQLLGIFGPAGAIAGAGLAITTAIVAPLIDSRRRAQETNNTFQELETTLGDLESAVDKAGLSVSELAEDYGRLAAEAKKALENISVVESVKAMAELTEGVDEVEGGFSRLQKLLRVINSPSVQSSGGVAVLARELRNLKNEFSLTEDSAENLLEVYNTFVDADTLDGQINSAQDLSNQLLNTYGTIEEMPSSMQDVFELINKWVERAARYSEITDESTSGTQRLAEQMQAVRDRAREAADAVLDLQAALQSGVQDVRVQEAGLEALEAAIERGASEAQARAAQAIAEAGARAEIEFREQGVTGPELQQAIARAQELERRRQAGLAREGDLLGTFDSGSSSGATPSQRNAIADLQQRIKLEEMLLGKTEAQKRLIRALGIEYSQYSEQVRQGLESQIQQLILAQEQQERLNSLQETMATSATDLFFSAARGADAFKASLGRMLQTLAEAIAQQAFLNALQNTSTGQGIMGFVAKAATVVGLGAGTGATVASADGNVFNRGNLVPFSSGGVVSSPQFFPMTGGRTGLMGEAGPEAIMPLRRGRDGRLGVAAEGSAGGTTVIQPQINIDARGAQQGVAEQINTQITQALPTIIEATVSATRERNMRGAR